MSRSFKKHPYCKHNCKDMKQLANQAVRHYPGLPNGKAYKKVFCSYDISDWGWLESFESYRQTWGDSWWQGHKSDNELYRDWYRAYKGK